jgi:hypothetical protein
MPPEKIKVALLLTNFAAPAWIYESIKKIAASDYAVISLIVKKQDGANRSPQNFNHLAYNLYRKFENRVTKIKPNAFVTKNIKELVTHVPVISVQSSLKDGFEYINENDIASIETYKPDVCIKLNPENLSGGILQSAKFGVWGFNSGEYFIQTGTCDGILETIKSACATAITLKIFTNDLKEGKILYQSFSSTNASIIRNQNVACWKASSFIPRKLKELSDTKGESFWEEVNEKNKNISYRKQLNTPPTNAAVINFLLKRFLKTTKRKLRNRFSFEQWIMLYNFNKANQFPQVSSIDSAYKEIIPPKNKFWADTFAYTHNGKHFIFFEEYVYKKKKAHISVIELDKTGKISGAKVVIDKPYHLSYPFVFKWQDEIYMIPESNRNRTIELYKCKSFPYEWEFQMNLMENVHAVDTTIHFAEDKVWLFANMRETNGASAWDELFLFYANTLLTTNWRPHPRNPIISDVRLARPAGNIFSHEGKLYRPSQDCSCTYGYATNINEIIILNEKEYCEKKVTAISPDWNKKVVAAHTFSFDGELSVIDARYRMRK